MTAPDRAGHLALIILLSALLHTAGCMQARPAGPPPPSRRAVRRTRSPTRKMARTLKSPPSRRTQPTAAAARRQAQTRTRSTSVARRTTPTATLRAAMGTAAVRPPPPLFPSQGACRSRTPLQQV